MHLLKINKYKLKFKSKPWITLGLQKSIFVKNKLLTNFVNKKDPILKEKFHTNYKKYRNLLSTLMKNIRKTFDYGNIGCGVFVDLQKVFDTVDHQILSAKMNHYGIRGVSND